MIGLIQQQESNRRIAEIKGQEENVLRNLRQAWLYNVNEPYYPSGKLESGDQSGFGIAFGGSSNTQSAFGNTNQTTFGGTSSSFGNSSSFGSSPFGSMPASAFSLGSREGASSSNPQSTFGTTASAFGNTSKSTFGQPASAFGSSAPTTSTFGSSPFTAKLPPAPMSSGLSSSQPTFGQSSILGASGTLPSAPGAGFGASKPTFGQTSALGALGSTPAFGQASSFSSPFAAGLGKSLGGMGTGSGVFGSKTTFGSFGQGSQPNAFVQAAQQQSPFMQAANQPSAFGSSAMSANSFGNANRFEMLNETNAGGDKDDDMTDQVSPTDERAATMDVQPISTGGSNDQTAAPPPVDPLTAPTPVVAPIPPAAAAAPPVSSTAITEDLSNALGTLSTKPINPQSEASVRTEKPMPVPLQPTSTASANNNAPRTTKSQVAENVTEKAIDAITAWLATEFVIGQIPETEPPVEVR